MYLVNDCLNMKRNAVYVIEQCIISPGRVYISSNHIKTQRVFYSIKTIPIGTLNIKQYNRIL